MIRTCSVSLLSSQPLFRAMCTHTKLVSFFTFLSQNLHHLFVGILREQLQIRAVSPQNICNEESIETVKVCSRRDASKTALPNTNKGKLPSLEGL